MIELDFGKFVMSKAGHDKDQIFVILKADSEYVYILDGIHKTFEKPKKKNRKHVQIIGYTDENLTYKKANHEKIINEDVKRAIKLYRNSKK